MLQLAFDSHMNVQLMISLWIWDQKYFYTWKLGALTFQ